MATGKLKYDSNAKAIYQKEVDSLLAKLNTALMNAPRERRAQVVANSIVKAKIQSNPDLAKDIASVLGLSVGESTVCTFSDGEISVNISETVRGTDVFVVQSTNNPVFFQ